jgi:hypothetical protein
MPIANLLAMALGLVVTATGVLGLAAPSVLVEVGRSLQSAGALYVLAVVRVAFGAILLWAASNSHTPRILRVLGVFIIIAGVATPFFGVERSHSLFDWWSTQGSSVARAWPIAAIVFGLFIAYTASPRYAG